MVLVLVAEKKKTMCPQKRPRRRRQSWCVDLRNQRKGRQRKKEKKRESFALLPAPASTASKRLNWNSALLQTLCAHTNCTNHRAKAGAIQCGGGGGGIHDEPKLVTVSLCRPESEGKNEQCQSGQTHSLPASVSWSQSLSAESASLLSHLNRQCRVFSCSTTTTVIIISFVVGALSSRAAASTAKAMADGKLAPPPPKKEEGRRKDKEKYSRILKVN